MKRLCRAALLILALICACSSCHQGAVYVKIAARITDQTGKKLQRERGLFLIGTGGGMMHDIQMMMMAFNFYNPLPIEYIRPLLICAVEEYLYAINSNERVRPYLHNYPFTPENVEIIIQFLNRDGSFLAPGEIEIAKAKDGQLIYTITDVETQRLKDIHEESFEEALRICRNQDEASLLPQETVSQ